MRIGGALPDIDDEDVAACLADQDADEAREAIYGWWAEESEELGPAPQDSVQ